MEKPSVPTLTPFTESDFPILLNGGPYAAELSKIQSYLLQLNTYVNSPSHMSLDINSLRTRSSSVAIINNSLSCIVQTAASSTVIMLDTYRLQGTLECNAELTFGDEFFLAGTPANINVDTPVCGVGCVLIADTPVGYFAYETHGDLSQIYCYLIYYTGSGAADILLAF